MGMENIHFCAYYSDNTPLYDLHKITPTFMQIIKSHFMICINNYRIVL